MATELIEVVDCDRSSCKSDDAYTWVIMSPDGEWRKIDLCHTHDKTISNLFTLAVPLSRDERPTKRK